MNPEEDQIFNDELRQLNHKLLDQARDQKDIHQYLLEVLETEAKLDGLKVQ